MKWQIPAVAGLDVIHFLLASYEEDVESSGYTKATKAGSSLVLELEDAADVFSHLLCKPSSSLEF